MSENEKTRRSNRCRSAFALAKRLPVVAAAVDVDQVLHLRPGWTEQQAAEFLLAHSNQIGQAMALRGTEVLVQILPRGGGGYVQ